MPKVGYTAENFGPNWGANLQGKNELDISWGDIVQSAITVGKMGWSSLWNYGVYSIYEIFFRTSMIYTSLMENNGYIFKTPLYENLDPSEKSAISYFIGMAITKLASSKLFNVEWLAHVGNAVSKFRIVNVSNSRPDLFGSDERGGWYVFEAKGRTHGFDRKALNNAKMQSTKLITISGSNPVLRAAVEASFDPYLNFHICDPEGHDEEGIRLDITPIQALQSYYGILEGITSQESEIITIENKNFRICKNSSFGARIGVYEEIFNIIQGTNQNFDDFMDEITSLKTGKIQLKKNEKATLYNDGIIISLDDSWGDEMMKKSPAERKINH